MLGAPTTDQVPLPDRKGKYRNYRGSLFGLHGNMASIRVSLHTEHPDVAREADDGGLGN